jgi:hypothetical protein
MTAHDFIVAEKSETVFYSVMERLELVTNRIVGQDFINQRRLPAADWRDSFDLESAVCRSPK